MLLKKLGKKIGLMLTFKKFIIGLILSILFLKLNSVLNDPCTFIINILISVYLLAGLTFWLYKYFKKDHRLLNIFILLLITGLLILTLDLVPRVQQDFYLFTGFIEDVLITHTLILLTSSMLVLIVLIYQSIIFIVRKKKDLVKLIMAFIFLLISVFIFYPPSAIKNDAVFFYYRTINPKAGLSYYEKQYKDETERAENYRIQVNNVMTELQENQAGQKTDEYLLSLLKNKKTTIDDLFKNREESLKKLIEIDKLGEKIRILDNQKTFFKKRMLADENEIKAFTLYKIAQERFTNGSIIYYGFWNLFHTAINSTFSPDQSVRNTDSMAKIEEQINNFYSKEVKMAKDDNILSKEIIDQIDRGYDVLVKLFEYQKFSLTKPSQESLKVKEQELLTMIQERGDTTDSNIDMFMDWVDTFIKPGFYLQDKEHQRSFNYFKEAYDYAKKQKMDAIFTVWSNDYPGYEKPQPEPVTLRNSKEAVEGYYKIYENSMVKYIRTALNAYLDGDPQNIITKAVKEKDEDENYTYGLDSFEKEYYKSRFVVILNEDFPYGGNQFTIMFQDKPDRFFAAWVYEKPDKTYELRGFSSAKIQRQEDIKKVNTEFKDFLMDKQHSL